MPLGEGILRWLVLGLHQMSSPASRGFFTFLQTTTELERGFFTLPVGNQQKCPTFVKERSRGCGSIVGLPALPVVALTPL